MKKKTIIIAFVAIVIAAFGIVYYYFNHEDSKTSFTISEKKWVANNSSVKINLDILNDVPILGNSGIGVLFDFTKDFELETGLEFNKIPYLKDGNPTSNELKFRYLTNDVKLTNKDLLLLEDGYILISNDNKRFDDISQIRSVSIGIITKDMGDMSYYLKESSGLTYKTYQDINELLKGFEKKEVNYIVLPQIKYLEKIINLEGIYINYYFSEISNKLVLTLTDNNEKLNLVVKKYFENWKQKKYVDSYNSQYLNYYASIKQLSNRAVNEMTNKTYTYGYVENTPYQVNIDGVAHGIAGSYIERIKRLTDAEIKYKLYKNRDALKSAINKGEIDIYFDDSGISTSSYKATSSPFIEKFVVISKPKYNNVVTSFESLKNKDITMMKDTLLFNYIKENAKSTIKIAKDINELSRSELVIIDKEIYMHYKNTKFKGYEVLYEDYNNYDYKFYVKNNNSDFYNLFNYIINTNSYYNYRNNGLESLNISVFERTNFQQLYLIVLGLILLPIFIVIFVYLILKNKKNKITIKKEDRRKYTDMLTSLKNRNYLNLHVEEWENSKIYPQSIIVVDLNNVKYVNDNYGHEEGDKLIVKAASILVNTQLENSEIIRTDGNEFLIYLVGYTERQIDIYTKKIVKEFKELPHGFGASVGYSIIEDDIKSIDDAINEATIDMREKKEENK